jgi:hypothetical protein
MKLLDAASFDRIPGFCRINILRNLEILYLPGLLKISIPDNPSHL